MLIKVNNNNIHYIKSGNPESNKTILFIHGSAMTGILMERVYNLLPEFNNISLDLPGHNKSEGELLSTPELLADFITDFIKEMKLKGEITDDLTVAGYSLGGCITLELALRRVSDVKRIVVLNSCDFANSELAKIVPDLYENYDPSNVFSIVFGSKSTPKETSTYFAEHRSSSLASYTDLKAATSYVLKDFNKIYIPTMFIACGQDKLAPIENIKKLHSMIQNSSLSIIPFYGHLGILETPEIYAQNIKDFINYNGFSEIDEHKFEHFTHSIPHLSDALVHEEINKTFQLVIDSLKEDNPAVAEKYAYSVAFSLYDDPNAKDPFWSNSAKSLVTAIILAIATDCIKSGTEEKVNMYSVANFLASYGSKNDCGETGDQNALDLFFKARGSSDPASIWYATSNFAAGNTRSSIFSTAMDKLQIFASVPNAKFYSVS